MDTVQLMPAAGGRNQEYRGRLMPSVGGRIQELMFKGGYMQLVIDARELCSLMPAVGGSNPKSCANSCIQLVGRTWKSCAEPAGGGSSQEPMLRLMPATGGRRQGLMSSLMPAPGRRNQALLSRRMPAVDGGTRNTGAD